MGDRTKHAFCFLPFFKGNDYVKNGMFTTQIISIEFFCFQIVSEIIHFGIYSYCSHERPDICKTGGSAHTKTFIIKVRMQIFLCDDLIKFSEF